MRTRAWIRLSIAGALAVVAWTGPTASGSLAAPDRSSARTMPSASRDRPAERGIVQSVSATSLVLKALDGTTLTVAVDSRTRVFVDDRPASILDVRPGFVAVVSLRGTSSQPALEIRAYATTSTDLALPLAGVVESVSATAVVLTGLDGAEVSVAADTVARVLVDGKKATLAAVRSGFVAVVRATATGKGKNQKKSERRELDAFSSPRSQSSRIYYGVIRSISTRAIVLQTPTVAKFRFALGAKTAIFLDGKPGSTRGIEVGDLAVARTGPGREVWAFSVP